MKKVNKICHPPGYHFLSLILLGIIILVLLLTVRELALLHLYQITPNTTHLHTQGK